MAAPTIRDARVPIAVILGLFLASVAMRPQILAIGPVLPLIRDDLGLPASVAGLLTTIPVLCMGLFAPIGPRVAARLGPTNAFDVADDPSTVGSVAALMLMGGYVLSSIGPVVMGAARDAGGSFDSSLWLLVVLGVVLTLSCLTLTPARLRRGVGRAPALETSGA
ncbi:hypothetical protein BH20CHL7_BH20CHL7_04270 [soil metagenome]